MDTLLCRLLKRGHLEEKRDRETKRIAHVEALISQFQELESGMEASEIYKAEIHDLIHEADDVRASITALDGELAHMKAETEAQEQDYDDVDRQERIEEYEKIACSAQERIKRDAEIVKQSKQEMLRLAGDFGRWRGQRQSSELR